MCRNDDKGIAVGYDGQQGVLKKMRWNPVKRELTADFFERRSADPVIVNVSVVKPLNGKSQKKLDEKKKEILSKIPKKFAATAHAMS